MRSRSVVANFAAGCALSAAFVAFDASTAAIDFGVNAGVGYSDNINRAAQDEVDEIMAAVGADVFIEQFTRRLSAHLAGSVAYVEYLDETYDNELIGNLFGEADIAIVPDRFSWWIQDNFAQTRRDAASPVTPENRENVNYFTTGPVVTLPVGTRTGLRLAGRYSDVYYEDSDFGNTSLFGSAALFRSFTEASRISLNLSAENTEYDNPLLAADYEEYEAFISYQIAAARTSLIADVGYTELRFDDTSSDGFLARLTLTRQLGPYSMLAVSAGREFSNSADLVRLLQESDSTGTSTQPVQATGSPFKSTYGRVDWDFLRNRTQLGAGAEFYKEDYEIDEAFNRKRHVYQLRAGRELNRTLSLRAEAGYARETYEVQAREFSELTGDVFLDWRMGRHWYTSMHYRWIDRSDDVAVNEFNENQIWLLVGYSRSGRGSRVGGAQMPGMGRTSR